jgi:hypothetical protein
MPDAGCQIPDAGCRILWSEAESCHSYEIPDTNATKVAKMKKRNVCKEFFVFFALSLCPLRFIFLIISKIKKYLVIVIETKNIETSLLDRINRIIVTSNQ